MFYRMTEVSLRSAKARRLCVNVIVVSVVGSDKPNKMIHNNTYMIKEKKKQAR
jgi:hypothetical protein